MKRFLAAAFGLVMLSRLVAAQSNISGVVINARNGQPLTGASIMTTHSQTGTVSRFDGSFVLKIKSADDTIIVSSIGFSSRKILIDQHPEHKIKIALFPAPSALNALVVTASKSAIKRTEAPVAISVISSKMLQQTKPTTLDQALNKVSGVYMVDLGNEQHTMAIRQPVSYRSNFLYLQDGLAIRTIGNFNHNALIEINQAAVKRIEVIKGPSSSLYGSDAVGGAINFISKQPSDSPMAELQMEGSSNGYKRVNLTAGNTFGKTGLLLSGYYANRHNGYMEHSDFNKLAVTALLEHKPDENNTLTAMITAIDYYTDMTGGLDSSHFFGKDYQSYYTFNYRKVKAWRGRVSWQHQRQNDGNSKLTFFWRNNEVGQNPHYRMKSTDDPLKAGGEVNSNFFKSYGLQFQYTKKIKPWHTMLLAGGQASINPAGFTANFIAINKNNAGYFTDYTKTDSLLTDYRAGIYSAAAFARMQSMPLQHLRIVAGLRYDFLGYDFDNYLPPSAYSGAPDGHKNFYQFSPKIGVTYDLGNDRGLYANYSIGFAPPDVTDLYSGVKIPSLQPARYYNIELGGWLAFDHHKGYAELSLYRMKGRNEIVTVRGSNGAYTKKNAGQTLHYGIEYTLSYNPFPQWQFRLSGTNVRHLYLQYEDKGNDYSDNEMNGAPHWISSAQLTYYPSWLRGMNISVQGRHLSAYFMDEANTMRYPGYTLCNLRVNYRFKKLEVWTQLINLFNANYATIAEKTAYAVSYRPGPLRTLHIGLGYRFGKGKQ